MHNKSLKIAAVIPRFGAEIGGGAETLMRELLISLKKNNSSLEIDVLTTCSKDHRTWDNFYPEGELIEDGINVKRFLVSQRNINKFISAEQKLAQGFILSFDEQIEWLENSVNSKSLYDFLIKNSTTYDFIFYAPYLFGTSFWGPLLNPKNSILVPCLHDEAYAYLPIFRFLFRQVLGVMWNAEPEAELANKIYRIPELDKKGIVVGMGFDELEKSNLDTLHDSPYVLYSGRKETGKNLDYLIECYEDYRLKANTPFDLIIIGSGEIDFRDKLPEGVYDKGFVSEIDKRRYISNASLFIQPSVNESFSIVLMEAWREKVPVLVHSDCAVTSFHVSESSGGMTFRSKHEFFNALDKIKDNNKLVEEFGSNGKNYVSSKYSWESVHKRFYDGINLWSKLKIG